VSHSVERHLEVSPEIYDAEIRRFVPGYEAMLEEVVGALAEHVSPTARVVDLGAGTGALAAFVAARFPEARLVLLDADAAMLERARERLAGDRHRIELRCGSFADPLPACDAAVASLSLHHVHDRDDKRAVYENVFRALAPAGVLITADAMVSEAPSLAEPVRRRWAAHLVAHGDTEEQAHARFAQWATEDRYFGVDDEIAMMRTAGFTEVDVRWRVGPTAVVVARRVP
jgi:tRNA (cmo5U34)-methyltransferase